VLEVFYHRAKFGAARITPAAGVAKNVEFLPAALRAAQAAGILFTQRQILMVFARHGRHVAPIGVKFGMEDVPSSMPNFTPSVLVVQERAPLSPCQVWWGSDFTRRRGGQKR